VHNAISGSLVAGLSRALAACAVALTTFIGCADAPPAEEAVGESRSAVEVPAEECLPGTYLDTSQGAATVCSPCTPIVGCVSSLTCTSATDSQCTECAEESYLVQVAPADACPRCNPVPFCTSAIKCTNGNDSTCSACAPGYSLDDRYQCRACQPGTYASADGCTACPSPLGCVGAVACTNATDSTCTACDPGYYLDTSVAPAVCKPCTAVSGCVSPVTCTTASNSQCTQCEEGTWKSGTLPSLCTPCSPVPFCTTAISCTAPGASECTACLPGYRLDAGGCVNIDECADGTDSCSPFASCTDTFGSFKCACNAGYSGDGTTCTPSCGSFGADPLLWGQPLARNGHADDTDPSAGGTLKYRYKSGSTIPVKVRALDCSSADITSNPNVSGTVHVYADLSCDGVADQEVPIDRKDRTGSPGTMKKTDGFLAYNLDTSELPPSPPCFVLEVVVRDTTTGNEAREKTLLQRK